MPAIGIDLGTTSCRVGVWSGSRVEILSNEDGSKSTPAFVSFSGAQFVVGESAKNRAYRNAKNTIFNVKRIVGSDEDVAQRVASQLPYQVETYDGRSHILAEYRGQVGRFLPEQILSSILVQLREMASSRLDESVTDAVISVPTFFSGFQRKAVEVAGKNAGLNVLNVIVEPVAAAIAFAHKRQQTNTNQDEPAREVLVLDLGGGTFDAALMAIEEGIIEVKATAGTSEVGGEDFDAKLVGFCVQDFKRRYRKDISGNERALRRLRNACEGAKRNLSIASQAYIDIDTLADDLDYSVSITQHQFEAICEDLFRSTITIIEDVLRRGKSSKEQVDDIVMVGGSSRIPRIVALVTEFFGKEVTKGVHADEAVVYGTACTAAMLSGDEAPALLNDTLVLGVLPLTLGIETQGGVMSPIVKRHTTIPTGKSATFTTTTDHQPIALIKIYEGDRSRTKDNKLVGVIQLSNLPLKPKGTLTIEVKFDVDGKMSTIVTATEKQSGQTASVKLGFDLGEKFPPFTDPYSLSWGIAPWYETQAQPEQANQTSPPPATNQNVPPQSSDNIPQASPISPNGAQMPNPHPEMHNAFNFGGGPNPHPAMPNPFNFGEGPNAWHQSGPNGFGVGGSPYPTAGAPHPLQAGGYTGPSNTMPNPYGPAPPVPPIPPQPPQPSASTLEDRLFRMEERYRLLEAKHDALEAKVRVLEVALNTRR